MATLEQIAEGIRRADAAGDTEAVKKLGAAYLQMKGGSVPGMASGPEFDAALAAMQNVPGRLNASGDAVTPQMKYDAALRKTRETYYPDLSDEEWATKAASPQLAPYDAWQLGTSGLLMGLDDEVSGASASLAALLTGKDVGAAFSDRQALEQARRELGAEQSGALGTAAQIGGSLFAGRPDMAAAKTAGFFPTLWKGGMDAAKQGAVYGFASTEGDLGDRARGAVRGATISAPIGVGAAAAGKAIEGVVNGVVRRGAEKAAVKAAPAASTIRRSAKSAFKEMEATGAVIQQPALNLLNHDMRQLMQAEGLISPTGRVSSAYPKVTAALNDVEDFALAPLGMKGAQTLHKSLRRVANSTDKEEALIGMKMLDQFENWMDSLPPSAVAGKADEAFNAWARGKSEWARFRKVQTLETAIGKAGRAKGGFAAGLRTQLKAILDNVKKQRGFTKAELDAMEAYVQGGTIQKLVETVTGLRGFLSAVGAGALSGNPAVTLGLMGAGAAARGGMNRAARGVADRMRANAALPGGLQLPAPKDFGGLQRFLGSSVRGAQPLIHK